MLFKWGGLFGVGIDDSAAKIKLFATSTHRFYLFYFRGGIWFYWSGNRHIDLYDICLERYFNCKTYRK